MSWCLQDFTLSAINATAYGLKLKFDLPYSAYKMLQPQRWAMFLSINSWDISCQVLLNIKILFMSTERKDPKSPVSEALSEVEMGAGTTNIAPPGVFESPSGKKKKAVAFMDDHDQEMSHDLNSNGDINEEQEFSGRQLLGAKKNASDLQDYSSASLQAAPVANIMNLGAGANLEIVDDNKEMKRQKTKKHAKVFADNIPSDDEIEDEVSDETLKMLNPIQHLSDLDAAAAMARIQSERITPFDRTHYTQCIRNPLAGTAGVSKDEMITVQIARPLLTRKDNGRKDEIHEKDMYQQHPSSKPGARRYLEYHEPEKQPQRCSLTNKLIKKEPFYKCKNPDADGENKPFVVCEESVVNHYLRKKISSHSHENKYYQRFYLTAVNDISEETGEATEITEAMEVNRQEDIKKKELQSREPVGSKVTASVFAELAEEPDKDQIPKKHALVSFWRKKEDYDTYYCYKILRIDKPLFLQPHTEGVEMKLLLHIGQNNEVFYFTKQANSKSATGEDIFFNILDTMRVVKNDNLEPLTTNVDLPPIKSQIQIADREVEHFIKHQFGRTTDYSVKSEKYTGLKLKKPAPPITALPQYIQHEGQSYLVWVANISKTRVMQKTRLDSELQEETNISDQESEWCLTPYRNIFFLKMGQSAQSIDFTVYNANLFLKLERDQNTDVVWFVRNKSVVLMQYHTPLEPGWCDKLTQKKIVAGVKNDYKQPLQIILKQYMFAPGDTTTRYEQVSEEMIKRFARLLEKKYLMSGRLHYQGGKRVTIIFAHGGVFSFELKERTQNENGDWAGFIGLNKGYRLMFEDWVDQPKLKGTWCIENEKLSPKTFTGEFNYKDCKWSGFFKNDQGTNHLVFPTFKVDHASGFISGDGKHVLPGGKRIDYSVDGKIDYIEKTFKFIENMPSLKIRNTYSGVYDDIRFMLKGKVEGGHNGSFVLQLITEANTSSVTLSLKGDKPEENLDLKGKFNVKNGNMKGKCKMINEEGKTEEEAFKIQTINHKDRAQTWLKNLQFDDGQFCDGMNEKGEYTLQVCGNMREFTSDGVDDQYPGYKQMRVDLIDLDENYQANKVLAFVGLAKQKTLAAAVSNLGGKDEEFSNKVMSLDFLLPTFFYQIQDEAGNLKLPPNMMTQITLMSENIKSNQFLGQMFFLDPLTKKMQLMFLQGSLKGNSKQLNLPCWPSTQSEDVMIRYPILAYKTQLATNNEIVFVNLATNQPQKILNVEPFRFVQFIENGYNPERHLSDNDYEKNMNTCIFFIVEYEGIYRIMYYKFFPYPLNMPKAMGSRGFQTDDCIRILSGNLDLTNQKHIAPRFTNEKIMKACTLQRPQLEGVSMMCVLQLTDSIYYFSLNNSNCGEISNENKCSMVKILMARGPFEEIYFAEENPQTGDQIVRLTFKAKDKLTKQVVKKFGNNRIYSMVLYHDPVYDCENYKPHSLMTIDKSGYYHQMHFDDHDSEPKILLREQISTHQNYDQIARYLDQNPWSMMIGDTRGFIVIQDQQSESSQKQKTVRSVAEMYSFNSQMVDVYQPHEFINDDVMEKIKKNQPFRQGEAANINSVKAVNWMSKMIYEVRDHSFNYFVVQNSMFTRQRELVISDQLHKLCNGEQEIFIGNSFIGIKVAKANQYLMFKQSDFNYYHTILFKNLKPLTTAQSDGSQYFQVSKYDAVSDESHFFKFEENPTAFIELINIDRARNQYLQLVNTLRGKKLADKQFILHTGVHAESGKLFFTVNCKPVQGSMERSDTLKPFNGLLKNDLLDFDDDNDDHISGKKFDFNVQRIKSPTKHVDQHSECFMISSEDLHIEPKEDQQIIYTKDYMVINSSLKLYFHRLDQLRAGKPKKKITDKNLKQIEIEDHTFEFNCVNIKHFFNDNNTKCGMRIHSVSHTDHDVIEKNEVRHNMIQISFSNLSLIWDLDEDKEVTFVENPGQLIHYNSFVRTGIVPHVFGIQKTMKGAKFLRKNAANNIFVQPALTRTTGALLFQAFCGLDMQDTIFIRTCETEDLFLKKIDFETVLAEFNGLTFFEIFGDNPDYMELIERQIDLQELKLKMTRDKSGNQSDNIIIRRLFWTLNLPVLNVTEDKFYIKRKSGKNGDNIKNVKNILMDKLFDDQGQHMLEPLLNILMCSEEFRLSNLVVNFDGFKQVFQTQSNAISAFMENSIFSNEQTIDVKSMRWNKYDKVISFGSSTSQLSPDNIKKYVEKEQLKRARWINRVRAFMSKASNHIKAKGNKEEAKRLEKDMLMRGNQTIPVTVNILEVEWLSAKESLPQLFVYMAQQDDAEIFDNGFIKILLEQQSYGLQIFGFVFLPYLFYAMTTVCYLSAALPLEANVTGLATTDYGDGNSGWMRVVILLFSFGFLGVEVVQAIYLRASYFEDFWNLFLTVSYLMNIYIVLEHVYSFSGCTYDQMINIGAISVTIQWFVLYYWMRLVPSLAFFVTFLVEVIKDIAGFVVMFVICILMFGNAIYIIHKSNGDERSANFGGEEDLFTKSFENEFIDSMFGQYQITIGMGDIYTGTNTLPWIFYMCTTLFTQLTFFNMLIGIMGQTFERVCEGRERNSLMERTKMTADFLWILILDKKIKDKRYLYLIRPEEDEEAGQVEGSIGGIKRQLLKLDKKMTDQLVAQAQKISSEVADNQMVAMSTLNEKTAEIEQTVKNFKGKFEEILTLLKNK